tara:strand:- start:6562 stop:6840 length:279 start_codon:yes stop_codon:yes gene_type:complete
MSSKSIREPPINCHYRQCKFEFDEKLIPFLIGNDGKHFKRITNMSNTNYIWWNNEKKIIELWGPENRLDLAENILRDHIKFVENKNKKIENS